MNIPLSKIDHPAFQSFLVSRVTNGGAVPKSDQIVNGYLPDLYAMSKEKLKNILRDQKVQVQCDETTDCASNCVLNVLVQVMNKDAPIFLADSVFLEKTNNVTVAQAVVKVLTDYGIAFNDVLIFNSDNVSYMQKAFEETLSVILPNAVHITCMAHIINLVATEFKKPFHDLNTFVKKFSAMLWHAEARKARLVNYLKEKKLTGMSRMMLLPTLFFFEL